MRRMVLSLAAAALTIAGGFALIGQPQPTGPSPVERIVSGGQWALSSPGATTQLTYPNDCAPAQAAACQQILNGVGGVLAQAAADQVFGFITTNH